MMMTYAGLDVSLRETSICVVDDAGVVCWEGKVATEIDTIAGALRRHAPELVRVGMETGPVAVWLSHGLAAAGEECQEHCVSAASPVPV